MDDGPLRHGWTISSLDYDFSGVPQSFSKCIIPKPPFFTSMWWLRFCRRKQVIVEKQTTLEHTKDSFHTPSTFKNRKGKTTKNHHVSLVVSQSPRPTISFLEPRQKWQQPILDQLTRPTKTTRYLITKETNIWPRASWWARGTWASNDGNGYTCV